MIWTLPNIITVARIGLAPVIALLPFIDGYTPKFIAFIVFLVAALSDLVDGYLARERGLVTDLGKELDPLADKLLLVAALVPIYWLTRHPPEQYQIPWWGSFPLWVVLILLGRELAMTVLRRIASNRGVVIASITAGKVKTVFQNIFIGGAILWFAWRDASAELGWRTGWFGAFWDRFHGAAIAIILGVAVFLTVYSLLVYLYRFRNIFLNDTNASR